MMTEAPLVEGFMMDFEAGKYSRHIIENITEIY